MKNERNSSITYLIFSQWSRKNYAIFASLRKVVKISSLSVDICNSSLRKNISIQSTQDFEALYSGTEKEQEEKLSLPETILLLIFNMRFISPVDIYSSTLKKYRTITNVRYLQISCC